EGHRRATRARDRRRLSGHSVLRAARQDRRRRRVQHARGVRAGGERGPRHLERGRAVRGNRAAMSLRVAIPDLISPSYFPAIAAVELGCFRQEGFDATVELLFPVTKTYDVLPEGSLGFVRGSMHGRRYALKRRHDWSV